MSLWLLSETRVIPCHSSLHPTPRLAVIMTCQKRTVGGKNEQVPGTPGILREGDPFLLSQPGDHLPASPCIRRTEDASGPRRKNPPGITSIDEDRPDVAFGGQTARPAPPSEAVHTEVGAIRGTGVEPSRVHAAFERRVRQGQDRFA